MSLSIFIVIPKIVFELFENLHKINKKILTQRKKTDIFIMRLEGVAKRLPERYKYRISSRIFFEDFDVIMLY